MWNIFFLQTTFLYLENRKFSKHIPSNVQLNLKKLTINELRGGEKEIIVNSRHLGIRIL